MESTSVQARIEQKLQEALNPTSLEVINESHLHAGHQPAFDGSGETHFRIKVVSQDFDGVSRVNRHRQVNALVKDLMDEGLHAIAIDAKSESEELGG